MFMQTKEKFKSAKKNCMELKEKLKQNNVLRASCEFELSLCDQSAKQKFKPQRQNDKDERETKSLRQSKSLYKNQTKEL